MNVKGGVEGDLSEYVCMYELTPSSAKTYLMHVCMHVCRYELTPSSLSRPTFTTACATSRFCMASPRPHRWHVHVHVYRHVHVYGYVHGVSSSAQVACACV